MESGVIIANVVGLIDPHTARLAIRPMNYLAAAQGEGGVKQCCSDVRNVKNTDSNSGDGIGMGDLRVTLLTVSQAMRVRLVPGPHFE